jgi:hypothetical protein
MPVRLGKYDVVFVNDKLWMMAACEARVVSTPLCPFTDPSLVGRAQRSYVVYPPEAPRPPSLEEFKEMARVRQEKK